MEKQAEYNVVIPGVTGPTYTTTDNISLSFLPEVHGEVEAVVVGGRVLGVDVSHWQGERGGGPGGGMGGGGCEPASARIA